MMTTNLQEKDRMSFLPKKMQTFKDASIAAIIEEIASTIGIIDAFSGYPTWHPSSKDAKMLEQVVGRFKSDAQRFVKDTLLIINDYDEKARRIGYAEPIVLPEGETKP